MELCWASLVAQLVKNLPVVSRGSSDPGIEAGSPALQADDLLTELLLKAETIVEA